jgi:SAM-dependent methyltransferase
MHDNSAVGKGAKLMLLATEALRRSAKRVPGAVALVRLLRKTLIPHDRAVHRLEKAPNRQLLQPSPTTRSNRYPEYFGFVRGKLARISEPHILSYGCSTGEEVFTLREYFPAAQLTGIDINPNSIAICERSGKAAGGDPATRFVCAGSCTAEPDFQYDAIFCMAVLRHGALQAEMPERCDAHLGFAQVDALVTDLARCLKPGGFLTIWNSHFRFSDMTAAAEFDVAWTSVATGGGNFPLYGPDNCRLDVPTYADAVFRKRGV